MAAIEAGGAYTLFTGVDELVVNGAAYSSPVDAHSVFENVAAGRYNISYDAADNGGPVVLIAPEPATATLSLLALAGLALRRRSK